MTCLTGSTLTEATLLAKAVQRVMTTQAEYARVATLSATNGDKPKQPDSSQVAGFNLDYWLSSTEGAATTSYMGGTATQGYRQITIPYCAVAKGMTLCGTISVMTRWTAGSGTISCTVVAATTP